MRGAVIALGMAAAATLPAIAQRGAAEIALAESPAPAGATVLGEVRAEIHQTSLIAKTPARDLADRELRTQAAKLGADAVVDIKYEGSSPLFSKKGFRAVGKAVKFSQAPAQAAATTMPPAPEPGRTATVAPAAQPAVAPAAAPPTPPVVADAAPPAPIASPRPQVAAVTPAPVSPFPRIASAVPSPPPVAPSPPQVAAVAPPPASVAPPVVQPAPVPAAAVPAAPRGPTPEALIVLTEEDLAGRTYERLGEVTVAARQTSLFPKKSARAMMDEQLRARAAALGADAVILIRYEAYSPLTSKKGASATGVAVKYR